MSFHKIPLISFSFLLFLLFLPIPFLVIASHPPHSMPFLYIPSHSTLLCLIVFCSSLSAFIPFHAFPLLPITFYSSLFFPFNPTPFISSTFHYCLFYSYHFPFPYHHSISFPFFPFPSHFIPVLSSHIFNPLPSFYFLLFHSFLVSTLLISILHFHLIGFCFIPPRSISSHSVYFFSIHFIFFPFPSFSSFHFPFLIPSLSIQFCFIVLYFLSLHSLPFYFYFLEKIILLKYS